jgi:intein-encoded DNA endonuclease-like protein
LGYPVLVSNFAEHYELTNFLSKCKPSNIGVILGMMNILQILDTSRYENPISDILKQIAKLFSQNIKLIAYGVLK